MIENITATQFILAISGGFLPALIWLWFWLKEDIHPEPKGILILSFVGGMVAVVVALLFEYIFSLYYVGATAFLLWAFTEEILKYLAAWWFALRKKSFDDPVDALIYLITVALGFASLENIFFVLNSFIIADPFYSFITGNMRFLGATLLHIATSGIVGVSIAYSFFHTEHKWRNIMGGIMLATILHFIFNYSIINSEGVNILKIFLPLWLGIIVLIFLFEKVKKIKSC